MLEGGYIYPNESPEKAIRARSKGAFGMEVAREIFYNYVSAYRPSLLSPQYDAFSDASKLVDDKDNLFETAKNRVRGIHDELTIMTLSQTLLGVEQQALSYRRDAYDKDYPTQ